MSSLTSLSFVGISSHSLRPIKFSKMLLNCMIWGALVTSSEGRLIVQEYQPSECFCTLQSTLKVKVVLVVYLLCLDLLSLVQALKGPAQPDRITKIRLQFQTFLSEATGFYHDLIVKMRAKYGLPLASGLPRVGGCLLIFS
ncbi:hypothetical protein L3X38_037694 [Prunus dulcis]|uniref:Uncharacterized protein n=1 Tax=Prunus dulcis TaxID=3755 RepID=A0AAD4V604_PRUDU|nr:hypothetical protein L3X38_037694 [Prunus dulcis]